ncbi:PD-(D/E)XK nuclease family protein, partial [Corynebacterium pyruviciproducens]|uniref:ATP-dependent DNA helicase n=1 Tax=Corynebacterium pyruviciproducens TaxID=598660 RepID=UPI0024561EA4|nr:ATP-dependent DNA helicase [Corynebacterium pyruviciproducens]MDH4657556.1 ATP-dependent helicase [Corynebacterium pyruviciproducens]
MRAPELRLVPPKRKPLIHRQWPQSAEPLLAGEPGSYLITGEESGAGVTSLMREAVVNRLRAGADPDSLLVITHSKRSALAFEEALWSELVTGGKQNSDISDGADEEAEAPYVAESKLAQSVHSLAFSIVRYAAMATDSPMPRLMTGAEQDAVFRELLKGNQQAGGDYWPPERVEALDYVGFARGLRDFLLRAGERGLTSADLKELGQREGKPLWSAAGEFLDEYTAVMNLQQMHHLNASELLITAVRTLEADPSLVDKITSTMQFLAVDNAQHLDPLSQRLVTILGERIPTFVVGGNPHALVYSFRGANPDLLEETAGKVQIFLHSSFRKPEEKRIFYTQTEADNLSVVAKELREAHLVDGVPWEDMVVITRSLGHIPALQRALATADVPVHIDATDVVLGDQPIVQAMLKAVDIVLGNGSEEDILELAIGPVGGADPIIVRRLQRRLGELGPIVCGTVDVPPEAHIGEQGDEVLHRLRGVIAAGQDAVNRGEGLELVLWAVWDATGLSNSKLYSALRGGTAGAQADRDLNSMMELFDLAGDFVERVEQPSLEGFIEHLASQDLPSAVRERQVVKPKAVSLLTAHGAIDGEWDTAIIAGADDDSWPSLGLTGTIFDQEQFVDLVDDNVDPAAYIDRLRERLHEEQRLFTLMLTRATRRLVITAVKPLEEDSPLPKPSRFVEQLEDDPTFTISTISETDELPVMSMRPFIAELRRAVTGEARDEEERNEAARLLAVLAEAGFVEADPAHWWGLNAPTDLTPLRTPGEAAVLSPSQVEAGLKCPLKMVLNSCTPTEQTSYLRNGTLLHALAEAAALLHGDADAIEKAKDIVLEAYLESRTVAPWQEERDEAEFVELMEKTITKMSAAAGTLVGVEIPMRVTVGTMPDGGPIQVKGRLDRVQQDSEGRYKVYDLKTGTTTPTKEAAKSHPQLAVYQLGINNAKLVEDPLSFVTSESPESTLTAGGAELVYPRRSSPLKQDPLTADNAEILLAHLRELVEHTSDSTVPGFPTKNCSSCDFRKICPTTDEGRSINEVHS